MSIEPRAYAGPADLADMVRLTEELRGAGQRVYPIAADLYEELDDADAQRSARLWHGEGRLLGFAYVNRWQNLVDVFRAEAFDADRQAEVMAWLVAAARERNRVKGETQALDASSLEDDLQRLAMLERFGFVRLAETSLLLARRLEDDLPTPQLPAGFAIRPLDGMAELDAYVRLHRAAFGSENMTVDFRRAIMSTPGYLPELDLVATASGGELAAFCVCQIFADDSPRAGGTREGWTDPLGTHPAYRGLGLARALMLTGMRLLQERGIDTALLGTSSTNAAMQRLALGTGFQVVSNTLWFRKALD